MTRADKTMTAEEATRLLSNLLVAVQLAIDRTRSNRGTMTAYARQDALVQKLFKALVGVGPTEEQMRRIVE